jgi:hypothetical protein
LKFFIFSPGGTTQDLRSGTFRSDRFLPVRRFACPSTVFKTMIQRILIDFRYYADADLLAFSQNVLTRIAETPALESLRGFTTAEVTPAFDAYKKSLPAAADGGRTAIAAKRARKALLIDKMTLLASQVEVLAADNRELLLSSGFLPRPVRGGARANSAMGAVGNLKANTGLLPGTADIAFAPVPYTRLYSVEHSTDQNTWSNGEYPSATRLVLAGLRSKTDHYIRVRALGADQRKGPWSEPVSVYVR